MSRASQKLIAASGGEDAYEIDQSVQCSIVDASKIRRTPSSEGNRKTFTFSTWCKRSSLGLGGTAGTDYHYLMGAFVAAGGGIDDSHYFAFGFHRQDQLIVQGWSTNWRVTNRVFRDTSAWYHLVLQFDTTQGTADNRIKVYVNGVQETSFSVSANPSENFDVAVNNTVQQAISDVAYDQGSGPYHFDGYMAETHLFDGAVVAPSEFGETDSETNAWIPKKYVGSTSYGTNGYYMKFASGAIGTDSSGNGNNYTTTNLANSDVVLDTPTNNFPTVNSAEPYNSTVSTLVQGNRKILAAAYSSGNYGNHFATFKLPESGKWYVEMIGGVQAGSGNRSQLLVNEGFIIPTQASSMAANANSTGLDLTLYGNTLDMYDGGSDVGTQVTGLTGSYVILALAIDVDNNKVYGGYDSGSAITWLNSGDPAAGSNGQAHTFTSDSKIGVVTTTSSDNANRSYNVINFGQSSSFTFSSWTSRGNADGSGRGDFYYSPPPGFKALCAKNLPTPAVKKPSEHFNPVLYLGNDSTNNITGVGFQPGLVWLKNRTEAANHEMHDAVRGSDKGLQPDTDVAEADESSNFTGFASDGFNLASGSNRYNDAGSSGSGENYVAWNWKANGSGSTNNDGAQTTVVSANTTAGFSIATFTGTGSSTNFGHGLGVAPKVYIMKRRDDANYWWIGTTVIDGSHDFAKLNTADGFSASSLTAPTSSVFYSDGTQNTSSATYVAYVFAEVPGFSKFGSYTGNGNNPNGPYIYTGFKPALVIIKETAGGTSWIMLDNKRDPSNVASHYLLPDLNNAEADFDRIDFLSNGFKLKQSYTGDNSNGVVYFYMAFAESPFKYANAR